MSEGDELTGVYCIVFQVLIQSFLGMYVDMFFICLFSESYVTIFRAKKTTINLRYCSRVGKPTIICRIFHSKGFLGPSV